MKKEDLAWGTILLLCIFIFVIPTSRELVLAASNQHPYIAGFIKFAILAMLGELLGKRIVTGRYSFPASFIFRMVVWGIIGLMVTLVFQVYMGGAATAQEVGILPFFGSNLALAIFGSSIMNVTFAPVMNTFHRLCDLFLEIKVDNKSQEKISIALLIKKIDWVEFITFNWLKIGIFFWIPVHSLIFLLPTNYRVVAAAFSSIALGIILAYATKRNAIPSEEME